MIYESKGKIFCKIKQNIQNSRIFFRKYESVVVYKIIYSEVEYNFWLNNLKFHHNNYTHVFAELMEFVILVF